METFAQTTHAMPQVGQALKSDSPDVPGFKVFGYYLGMENLGYFSQPKVIR